MNRIGPKMTDYEKGYDMALAFENDLRYVRGTIDFQRGWNDCLTDIFNLGLTETNQRSERETAKLEN